MNILKRDAGNKTFIKKVFLSLTLVATISGLCHIIIRLVDTFCISKYIGDPGLTAVSLASPLNQVIYGISAVFSVGGELLITKLIAKGDVKNAKNSLLTNFIFLTIIGSIFSIVVFFAAKPISIGLGFGKTSDQVIEYTCSYLKGFVIGVPFMFLVEYFFSIAYLDNDKTRPTISVFVLLIANIILDFLFAKYFTDKCFGIGLASSISYILSALVLFTHFTSKKSGIQISFKGFKFNFIKQSFVNGLPVAVKNISSIARVYLLNLIIITVCSLNKSLDAELIIAAHQIEDTITTMLDSVVTGVISSTILLSSVFYSEEDENALDELTKTIIKFGLIVGISLTIIYFFSSPYIAPLLSDNPIVIKEATYGMRAKFLSLTSIIFCSTIVSFFQGTKHHVMANVTSFIKSLILPILFTAILGFTIGVKGIWIGGPIGYTLFVIIHVIFSFIYHKKVKFNARTLFFLKRDFGFKEEEMYEKEIYSIKDVYSLQNDVLKLCQKFNIDESRKQNVANCAEELANLIVLSGFSKNINKKKPYALIRVLYKKDKDLLILRTRDNCEKFDIKEKIEEIKKGNDKDPALNCSIKMILHMAKEIEYTQILKTNNMIIKL